MKRQNNHPLRTWAIKKVVKKATNEGPIRIVALGTKGALQIAKNEGYLDPENRSTIPGVAHAQTWAAKLEESADPYFHVDKDAVIRTLPGGRIGFKLGRAALRRAPIPDHVRTTASEAVSQILDKLEKPSPGSGGSSGLAA